MEQIPVPEIANVQLGRVEGPKNNKRIMPDAEPSSDIQDRGGAPSNTTTTLRKIVGREDNRKKTQEEKIWMWGDSQTTKIEKGINKKESM